MSETNEEMIKNLYDFIKNNHPMFNPEIRKEFRKYNKELDDQISIEKIEEFIQSKDWNSMTDANFEYNVRCFAAMFRDAHMSIRFHGNSSLCYDNEIIYKNRKIYLNINQQYKQVLEINGNKAEDIIEKLSPVLGYEIEERKNFLLSSILNQVYAYKMIGIKDCEELNLKIKIKEGNEVVRIKSKPIDPEIPFQYKIIDGVLVFKSVVCGYQEKLDEILKKINEKYKNGKFDRVVYDIRNNRGGNNSVMIPWHDFIKNNKLNVVAIVNAGTFSGGIWEAVGSKEEGAILIGDNVGEPICRFGNAYLRYDNDKFRFRCSSMLMGRDEIRDIVYNNLPYVVDNRLVLDEIVTNSIKDMNNGVDRQLNRAIELIKLNNKTDLKNF